jgi:hypothetical protein
LRYPSSLKLGLSVPSVCSLSNIFCK